MAGQVVVVGSLNVDVVVTVERLPAIGETVLGDKVRWHPGGKGLNQAVAAARLGADVRLVGAVGSDQAGTWLQEVVAGEGIDEALATVPGASGTAFVEIDAHGANRIIVVPGANSELTAEHVEAALGQGDIAVMLCQGEVPSQVVTQALRHARAVGATTILNPAPVEPLRGIDLRLVDVLVPNEHEASELTGMPCGTAVDASHAAQQLVGRGASTAVITRGDRGAVWATATAAGTTGAFRVHTVDTVAAGDAFCGALATLLAAGSRIDQAVRYATAAGALATTVEGAVPSLPTRDAVEQLLTS